MLDGSVAPGLATLKALVEAEAAATRADAMPPRSRSSPGAAAGTSASRSARRRDDVDPAGRRSSSGQGRDRAAAHPTRRHEMRYLLLIYGPEPSEDSPAGGDRHA